MKNIFLVLNILSVCALFAQEASDTLIYKSGTKSAGFFMKVEDKSIHFKFKGNEKVRRVSRANIIRIKVGEKSFVPDEFKQVQAYKVKKAFAIECEKNSDKKLLFVDLKDDVFGISSEIQTFYDSTCFDLTDKYLALEYFENNDIQEDNINDYHLLKVGKQFGVDFVISGYVYTVEVPLKYTSNTTEGLAPMMQREYSDDLYGTIFQGLYAIGNEIRRENAISETGTYVNMTLFLIDIKTGKKEFLIKNLRALKIG